MSFHAWMQGLIRQLHSTGHAVSITAEIVLIALAVLGVLVVTIGGWWAVREVRRAHRQFPINLWPLTRRSPGGPESPHAGRTAAGRVHAAGRRAT